MIRMLPSLPENCEEIISEFIREKVRRAGRKGVVIGMSGGLDSSVTAALCSMALGGEKVLGLIMPEEVTRREDVEDAIEVAKRFEINYEVIEIGEILRSYLRALGDLDKISLGNLKARIRMSLLYARANSLGYLVAGTSNKTELLLGYFTKYGDGASDFLPIGDLYKSQVRALGKKLGIPKRILEKRPSAGLYPGQYDEEELGFSYEILDSILFQHLDLGKDDEEIAKSLGIPEDDVERILRMMRRSYHKRRPPYILKISLRTPGIDAD